MFEFLNPLPQLPKYRGAYKVGSCEYEIPVSELPSDTRIPDSNVTTIKFRVYYPTKQTAESKTPVPWLPTPQKEGNRAYAKFLGLSERSSGLVANLPSLLSYPTLPVVHNGPLYAQNTPFPVAIFSHGLGGNFNTYSSFVGSLASCGVIVFAPEHRDQSAPISFVRSSAKGSGRPVPYRRLSHSPSVDVLNARNEMLRVRLWELEKLFTALTELNEGKQFTNFADTASEPLPNFQKSLDLRPSRVTWAGHSFGAATTVQFVKSVYYRQFAPQAEEASEEGWNYTPLYTPAENTRLATQITSESPLVLLDLWTMPLTAKTTNWLWAKPLPCYDRLPTSDDDSSSPNVVSIMSTQFYKWPEMVNRTKALLSPDPVAAYKALTRKNSPHDQQNSVEEADAQEPSPQLSLDPITKLETSKTAPLAKIQSHASSQLSVSTEEDPAPSETSTRTPSPARSNASSDNELSRSVSSSVSSLPLPSSEAETKHTSTGTSPQLYLIPTSAHLSQSDFGVLFPNVTKYLLKTIEPEQIMELNVRAAAAMMRGCGIPVANLDSDVGGKLKQGDKDGILLPGYIDDSLWKRIDLVSS